MNFSLTIDYELNGDGSGDVFKDLVDPTNKLLEIFESREIKITFFVEVLEMIRMSEQWDKGEEMGYDRNPVYAMREQILRAAQLGHDIQLHIHPQWYRAEYNNQKWILDMSNWRIADFNLNSASDLMDLVSQCKSYLEDLMREIQPDYTVSGFRAGGYNIMPSVEIYKVLTNLGFRYDSSVYAGGYENGDLSKFDYRSLSNVIDHWWVDPEDICSSTISRKELMELPIFSMQSIPIYDKFKDIFHLVLGKRRLSANTKGKIQGKNRLTLLISLFSKRWITWDFVMFSKRMNRRVLQQIIKGNSDRSFVLIGHSKSIKDFRIIEDFFRELDRSEIVITTDTLTKSYENIVKRYKQT